MDVVDPVFVDRSGRWRRLFTGLGAGLGVLLAAGAMLLVAGLGASPLPLPLLPAGGQGGQHGDTADAGLGTRPSPISGAASRRPSASPSASPPASPSAGETHDNRKTSHPGDPKPSRTK